MIDGADIIHTCTQLLELELKCLKWYPLSSAPAFFSNLATAGKDVARTSSKELVSWIAAQVSDIQRQVFDMPQGNSGCPEVFRPLPDAGIVLETATLKSQHGGEVQCYVLDA